MCALLLKATREAERAKWEHEHAIRASEQKGEAMSEESKSYQKTEDEVGRAIDKEVLITFFSAAENPDGLNIEKLREALKALHDSKLDV